MKLFLSYSSLDNQAVEQLALDLSRNGVPYWRDQERLYAGQRWPKTLGEAIASRDCVLLIWSKHAAASCYVEMEWCTAIALKKPVLPCRLDDTPLPPILASVQASDLRGGLAGLENLFIFLTNTTPSSDEQRASYVIEELQAITSTDPDEVLKVTRTRFDQRGWIIHNIFHGPVSLYQGPVYITPSISIDSNLVTLRQTVKRDWVEGVLAKSLRGVIELELGKQTHDCAIDHPLKEVIELEQDNVGPLPSSMRVIDIFNKVGGFLLILGEPGSGKTITLLELTRDLIDMAQSDPNRPVPIVLNLSTWTETYGSLRSWIIGELKSKYYVGKDLSDSWLKKSRLLLMLDGLDEVKEDARPSCVQAINSYLQEYTPAGIVVSCRRSEYEALPIRLQFKAAIKLLPLTVDQIDQYLSLPGLESIRSAIRSDMPLRQLAQSPLVLSIMVLAYKDERPSATLIERGSSGDELRTNLMNRYIAKMFTRKGEAKPPYTSEAVIATLSWLAGRLIERSQTVFLLESLQPDWLTNRTAQMVYWIGSRVVWALAIAAIVVFIAIAYNPDLISSPSLRGPTLFFLSFGLYLASGFGITTGLIDNWLHHSRNQRNRDSWKKLFVVRTFLYGIGFTLTTIVCSVLALPLMPSVGQQALREVMFRSVGDIFLYVAPLASFQSIKRDTFGDIRTSAFSWSWKRSEKGFIWGLIGSFAFFFILFPIGNTMTDEPEFPIIVGAAGSCTALILIIGPYLWRHVRRTEPNRSILSKIRMESVVSVIAKLILFSLITYLVMLLVYLLWDGLSNLTEKVSTIGAFLIFDLLILYFGILGAAFSGMTSKRIEPNVVADPNRGLKITIAHAFLSSCLVLLSGLLLVCGPAYLLGSDADVIRQSLFMFSIVAFAVALWLGTPVLRHALLRMILYWQGHVPTNVIKFLEYSTGLIFLQKVGGGYIFIHRLVMEHFASLEKDRA